MKLRAAVVLALLAFAVPLPAVDATHAAPPAPCHPRGCEEARVVHAPLEGRYGAVNADRSRAFIAGQVRTNNTESAGLVAFEPATMQVAWSTGKVFPTPSEVLDFALSADGTKLVTVGYGYPGSTMMDTMVLTHDAATGALLYGGYEDVEGGDDQVSVVVADAGRAYIMGHEARRSTMCNGNPGYLARPVVGAFDLATGQGVWSHRDLENERAGAIRELAVASGRLFAAQSISNCTAAQHPLIAYDAATGAILWTVQLDMALSLDGMVADGARLHLYGHETVNAREVGVVRTLDAATGAHLWTHRHDGPDARARVEHVERSPDGATLLVSTIERISFSSFRGIVAKLDAAAGAVVWTARTDPEGVGNSGSPTSTFSPDGERVVFAAGTPGGATTTFVLDNATGRRMFISVLDETTLSNTRPFGAWMSPDGEDVYTLGGHIGAPSSAFLRRAAAIAPPEAPTVRTSSPALGTIRVTWLPPEDDGGRPITSYVVERAFDFIDRPYMHFATVNGSTLTLDDTGVTLGRKHYYRVTPVNAVGAGVPDVEDGISQGKPDAPALNATLQDGEDIVLTWTQPADNGESIDKYRIYRGTSAASLELWFERSAGSGRTVRDCCREAGERLFYAVSAVNGLGEGPRSNVVDVFVPGPPGAPRNVTTGPGAELFGLRVAWDAPASDGGSPIVAYRVRAFDTDGRLQHEAILPGEARSHEHDGRLFATYAYTVEAMNAVGYGPKAWGNCAAPNPIGTLLVTARRQSCALEDLTSRADPVSPV